MLLPLVNRALSPPRIPTASLVLKSHSRDPNASGIRGRDLRGLESASALWRAQVSCSHALSAGGCSAPRKRRSMLSRSSRLAITTSRIVNFGMTTCCPVLKASHAASAASNAFGGGMTFNNQAGALEEPCKNCLMPSPGAIQVTETPVCASSVARATVNEFTNALEAA
jgi:hypothetical protein